MESNTVYLKNWFFNKKYTCGYETHECFILQETEKALKVACYVNAYRQVIWVPKSCVLWSAEDRDADAVNYEAEQQKRWEDACKAYKELVAYAQKMGVKGVREGLRKDTIIEKMKQAGVEIPA